MIRRFVPLAIAVAVATAPLVAAQAPPAKPKGLMASIQGVWQMTQVNGQDVAAAGQDVTITIKDSTYMQSVNGQVIERGTFTLDDTKKPATIDLTIVEGDDAGKTQLGVIEIEGSAMRGKLADPGAVRPVDFNIAEGSFVFVMTKKQDGAAGR
jgi:uncharacterized protein (TIGR03067 family)